MSENHGSFGTAIACIDGRAIEPVMNWMRGNFDVNFIDTVTKAGLDGRLHKMNAEELADLKKEILISVEKHHSKAIAVAGHDECAGNPVTPEQHEEDLRKDVEILNSWNLGLPVVGLWVYPKDGHFIAEKKA